MYRTLARDGIDAESLLLGTAYVFAAFGRSADRHEPERDAKADDKVRADVTLRELLFTGRLSQTRHGRHQANHR